MDNQNDATLSHVGYDGVAFLFWSDEHEKMEEKTKREVESSGIDRLDGSESSDVQKSAWGDQEKIDVEI